MQKLNKLQQADKRKNKIVNNQSTGKKTCTEAVWQLLASIVANDVDNYTDEKSDFETAIQQIKDFGNETYRLTKNWMEKYQRAQQTNGKYD